MRDLSIEQADPRPGTGHDTSSDLAYETRMAWIAALWAVLALLAAASALWESWGVMS